VTQLWFFLGTQAPNQVSQTILGSTHHVFITMTLTRLRRKKLKDFCKQVANKITVNLKLSPLLEWQKFFSIFQQQLLTTMSQLRLQMEKPQFSVANQHNK